VLKRPSMIAIKTMKRILLIHALAVTASSVAVSRTQVLAHDVPAATALMRPAKPALMHDAQSRRRSRTRRTDRRVVADVDARDQFGRTRLMLAAARNDLATVKALLAKGADVNATNADGYTALMYTASYGNSAMVRFLLDEGANVNARDKSGLTALMEAAKQELDAGDVMADYPGTVKALLEKGADVSLRDKDGRTALIYTEAYGLRNKGKIIQLIKSAEVKR
jgi:ankyrin repeat protein